MFFEDGTAAASASGTAGMGGVSSAQPGGLPGTTGTTGSGDISFYMLDKKGKKIKKGNPSEVSDMRYLEPAKGITKIEDIKESYMLSDEDNYTVNDCLQELIDDGFELTMLKHEKDREWFDADEGEKDYFDYEELLIGLHKPSQTTWLGNLSIRIKFDKKEITSKRISTLRSAPISETENIVIRDVENAAFQLINQLNYDQGTFTVSFDVAGTTALPRTMSNNINITLWRKYNND